MINSSKKNVDRKNVWNIEKVLFFTRGHVDIHIQREHLVSKEGILGKENF
jgi:hypothetical protein